MSDFFKKFPREVFQRQTSGVNTFFDDTYNYGIKATDITVKHDLKINESDANKIFAPYLAKDFDTPELLAHDYYGDVKYHWLILKANSIYDVKHEWIISQSLLVDFLIEKYYYLLSDAIPDFDDLDKNKRKRQVLDVLEQTVSSYNILDSGKLYEVDKETYDNTPDEQRLTISIFQQEFHNNEAKKKLKLALDTIAGKFQTQLEDSLDTIVQNRKRLGDI